MPLQEQKQLPAAAAARPISRYEKVNPKKTQALMKETIFFQTQQSQLLHYLLRFPNPNIIILLRQVNIKVRLKLVIEA